MSILQWMALLEVVPPQKADYQTRPIFEPTSRGIQYQFQSYLYFSEVDLLSAVSHSAECFAIGSNGVHLFQSSVGSPAKPIPDFFSNPRPLGATGSRTIESKLVALPDQHCPQTDSSAWQTTATTVWDPVYSRSWSGVPAIARTSLVVWRSNARQAQAGQRSRRSPTSSNFDCSMTSFHSSCTYL